MSSIPTASVVPSKAHPAREMVTITTPAAAMIAARADDAIPRFTPDTHCLEDIYRVTASTCGPESTICTFFQLGDRYDWANRDCMPGSKMHPATECPVSYTAASTSDSVNRWNSATMREIFCCPDGYGFTYMGLRDYPVIQTVPPSGPNIQVTCIARSNPTLLGSGDPPWTVTVTDGGDLNPFNNPTDPASMVVTIDPATDVLAAEYVLVNFEVSGDRSCAPDCANPWKNGDPWPSTTPGPLDGFWDDSDKPPTEGELEAQRIRNVHIVVLVLCLAALVGIFLWIGIATTRYKRKKERLAREGIVEDPAGGQAT